MNGVTWDQRIPIEAPLTGDNERRIELPLAIDQLHLEQPGWVLDAGCSLVEGVARYTQIWPLRAKVVHLTQAIGSERLTPHQQQLSFVSADLRDLSIFADGAFDRVGCISTLEHVGFDNAQYGGAIEADPESVWAAAREIARVTKRLLLITVPFHHVEVVMGKYWRLFGPTSLAKLVKHLGGRAELRFYGRTVDFGWFGGTSEPIPEAQLDATGFPNKINQLVALRVVK